MKMIIEQVLPKAIGAKDTLTNRLLSEAAAIGISEQELTALLAMAPTLSNAGCFLDVVTGLWRYEFGLPYTLDNGQAVLGTQMWVEVVYLCAVLACARRRLTAEQLVPYMRRLCDPAKHQDVLAEMSPMMRVDPSVPSDFEVVGHGTGNRAIDWCVGPHLDRLVLLDVKRRSADFRQAMDKLPDTGIAPAPDHDPALMFRSVESKFLVKDPMVCLQGVWITTDLKQDRIAIENKFMALDAGKVHFFILGDRKPDAHVVSRLPDDAEYIRALFKLVPSSRFTFERT